MKITADDLRGKILGALDPESQTIVRRVAVAGQQVLFSQQTHNQVFDDMMSGQGDVSAKLGNGIAHNMLVLFDQSKATMPKGALLPAGGILLANAAEFSDKNGVAPVDDAAFGEALQAMSVKIFDRFDPGFRQKVSQRTGRQFPDAQSPEQPEQPAQPGGLIQQAQGGM